MAIERAFFMIKPDGVKRYLSNLILTKVIEAGFKVVARKRITITVEQAEKLYAVHKGKPFYEGLIKFITSGAAIVTVIEGENAVSRIRDMIGPTDPRKAPPGTFRGDNVGDPLFTEDGTMMNICHGSDSPENAKSEIAVFFDEKDLK
jgi:nucleoside-diphosphate kinase